MKRIISLLLAAVMVIMPGVSSLAEDEAEAPAVRLQQLYPTDDTKGDESKKTETFPDDEKIYVSGNYAGGYQRYAYFKFDLSQMQPQIEKATFTITATADASSTVNLGVFVSENDDWTEETLTYNNADRSQTADQANAVAQFTNFRQNLRQTIDITQPVQEAKNAGKQKLTLVLRVIGNEAAAKSYYVNIGSKENANKNLRPYLMITNGNMAAPELISNVPVAPAEDAGIDGNAINAGGGMLGKEVADISGTLDGKGYYRYYFMKFDLRDAQEREIRKVTLSLFGDAGAGNPAGIYQIEGVEWQANGLTFNNAGALKEKMEDASNCIVSTQAWVPKTTNTFDLTEYIQQKVAAGEYMISLGVRTISNNGSNPWLNINTSFHSDAATRPGLAVVFGNEPMQVVENQPLYPSDDAGVGPDLESPAPDAGSAAVGGENYLFLKYDLRMMDGDAGRVTMTMTGTADSEQAYGVYVSPGADWNEYEMSFDNAPKELLAGEPDLTFRLPRKDAARTLDLTDAVLPVLETGERYITVALKCMEGGNDGFGLYTKETAAHSPYFTITFKKQLPPGGGIDTSYIAPVEAVPLDSHPDNINSCLKDAETFAITGTLMNKGYMRYYVMKYDLAGIAGRIKKATLYLWAEDSLAATHYGVYAGSDSSWSADGATYNNFDKSFLQNTSNKIGEATGITTKSTAAVDVTEGVEKLLGGGNTLITLGLRNVDTSDGNPWSNFYGLSQASVEKRPHLVIECYDESYPVAVSGVSLRSGNAPLTQMQPGYVTVSAKLHYNLADGNGKKVHVIFALCKGDETNYRIVDVQEQTKMIYDAAGSTVEADFHAAQGEFLKVFVWNESGGRMIGQPSLTIQ